MELWVACLIFTLLILLFYLLCNLLNLFSELVCEHVLGLLRRLREERDLFPDLNVLICTFRVLFGIVSHELQVLATSIALELREDDHWDVKGHVLQDLLPSVDLGLHREDLLHALVDGHLPECHSAPDSTQRRLIIV